MSPSANPSSRDRDDAVDSAPPTLRNADRDRLGGEIVARVLSMITFGLVEVPEPTSR